MADILPERFIQDAVAERLNDRYYRRRPAYVSTEVYTRLKRADVLLAFMRAPGRPYVVVVEAKSRTTIHQLRLRNNPSRASWVGRLVALALIVGLSVFLGYEWYFNAWNTLLLLAFMRAPGRPYVVVVEAKSRTTIHQLRLRNNPSRASWVGRLVALALIVGLSVFLGYEWYFNAWNTLLLLAVFLLGSAAITALVTQLGLSFTHSIGAIEQLGRYPANESWIAVGTDTFARPEEARELQRQCRKNGVGLILVNPAGKLSLRVIPRPRHAFNDYLSRYGKRDAILDQIDRNPDYGPTRPERRQNRRRFLNIAVLLALVGALVLLGYEQSYGPVVPDPFADPRYDSPEAVRIGGGAPAFGGEREELPPAAPPPDCPAVPLNEERFVVVDAVLPRQEANVRLGVLKAAGMRGHELLNAGCLDEATDRALLVVYTGEVYANGPRAEETARAYRDILRQLGVPVVSGRVQGLKRR